MYRRPKRQLRFGVPAAVTLHDCPRCRSRCPRFIGRHEDTLGASALIAGKPQPCAEQPLAMARSMEPVELVGENGVRVTVPPLAVVLRRCG
jgi:hypothetical protein